MDEISKVIKTQVEKEGGDLTIKQCEQYGLKLFDQFYFKKLTLLGKSEFGEVWISMDIERHELTTVKYIKVKGARDRDEMMTNISNFIVEKEILVKISKKGAERVAKFIGAYYSLDTNGQIENLILASESGDYTLEQLLAARKEQSKNNDQSYSPEEVLAFIAQICYGYKLLQELRIYHSDTKIANIAFSSSKKKFIIIGFGVSKFTDEFTNQSLQTALKTDDVKIFDYANAGTEDYCSPEKKFLWDWIKNHDTFEGYPESLKFFNGSKCDMWALGVCLEIMISATADVYQGDKRLEQILKGLKNKDKQFRFDANELCKFVSDNRLEGLIEESGLIKKELDLINTLNKKRREEVEFAAAYKRIEGELLPNELLNVAKEEYQDLVNKIGELNNINGIQFVHILGRLGNENNYKQLNAIKK